MSKKRNDLIKPHQPLPEEKEEQQGEICLLKRPQSRTKRILFIIGGTIALLLGCAGVVIPGLPCTPFVLLAGALYAKSSKKLHERLLRSKFFGDKIKNYRRRKGIPKSAKIKIILMMSAMVLFSAFVVIKPTAIKIVVLIAGVIGCLVVSFIVPTAKEERETPHETD